VTFDGTTISTAPSAYTHGQWNQFIVTRSGTALKIYINGQLSKTDVVPATNFPASVASNAFVIGQKQTALGVYDPVSSSHSRIKNFRVFDLALTAADCDRLGRTPPLCTNQALLDRSFIRYRLSTTTTVYDTANTGSPNYYAGLNTATVAGTIDTAKTCWSADTLSVPATALFDAAANTILQPPECPRHPRPAPASVPILTIDTEDGNVIDHHLGWSSSHGGANATTTTTRNPAPVGGPFSRLLFADVTLGVLLVEAVDIPMQDSTSYSGMVPCRCQGHGGEHHDDQDLHHHRDHWLQLHRQLLLGFGHCR